MKALVTLCIGFMLTLYSFTAISKVDQTNTSQKRYMKGTVVHVDNCGVETGYNSLCLVIIEHNGIDKPATVLGKVGIGSVVYKECRVKLGSVQCKEDWKNYINEDFLTGGIYIKDNT